MSNRKRSFGEKRSQSKKQSFVGRKEQVDQFRNNLQLGAESDEFINIFNVYGQGGVGKTTLLLNYEKIVKEQGWYTVFIDTENKKYSDILAIMNATKEAFEEQGATFKDFSSRYKDYLQKKGKLESDPNKPKTIKRIIKSGVKAGLEIGADVIPGGKMASKFLPVDMFAEVAGEWTEFAFEKFKNKDDVELVLNPIEVLTPLWLKDLYKCANNKPFALFFDTYEIANPSLDGWLFALLQQVR